MTEAGSESGANTDQLKEAADYQHIPLWVGIGTFFLVLGCLLVCYLCVKEAERDEERMSPASQGMAATAQANGVYMSKKRLAKKKGEGQAAADDDEPPNSARALIKKGRIRARPLKEKSK